MEKVVEVLSAKSCSLPRSYDSLEYFGDAVLKLVQTDCLIHSTDLKDFCVNLHEGDLSLLRSEMGCNRQLEGACHRLKM